MTPSQLRQRLRTAALVYFWWCWAAVIVASVARDSMPVFLAGIIGLVGATLLVALDVVERDV